MSAWVNKINWYKESESRRWKRLWHCLELLIIALSALAIIMVTQLYGDGRKLQPVFIMFAGLLSFVSFSLIPAVYHGGTFKRWHVQLITLGLGCGVGIAAIAAFAILELQLLSQ